MTPSTVQLWERIHAAGLATPDECRQWALAINKSGIPEALQDPARLAAELIRLGKITPFQANVLFRGLPIPLSIGAFRLTQSLEAELGKHWFAAHQQHTKEPTSHWVYLLTQETLGGEEIRPWPPSLELAEKHVALNHPSLDRWSFAGIANTNVVAICEARQGRSLSARLSDRSMEWSEAAAMIEQLAGGLQRMHEAGLVHGRLGPDAVWCVDDSEYVLRRDPLYPTCNPYAIAANTTLAIGREGLLSAAAPELTLPQSQIHIQSDLYALGCLWYRAMSGTSIFGAVGELGTTGWARYHATGPLPNLDKFRMPPAMKRCLQHLIAKNPTSRFASAAEVCKAIEFAYANPQFSVPAQVVSAPEERAKPSAVGADSPAIRNPLLQPKTAPVAQGPENKQKVAPKREAPKTEEKLPAVPKTNEAAASPVASPLSQQPTTIAPASAPISPTPISTAPAPNADFVPAEIVTPLPPAVAKPKKKKKSGKKSGFKKKKVKKLPVWAKPLMFGCSGLILVMIIALLMNKDASSNSSKGQKNNQVVRNDTNSGKSGGAQSPNSSTTSGDNANTKPIDPIAEAFTLVSDDGKQLWAPPQVPTPYTLELIPAGMEGMVCLSANVWNQQGALGSFGKWWLASQPELDQLINTYPMLREAKVRTVAIALYSSKQPGFAQAVFRLTLEQPQSIDSMTKPLSDYSMQLFNAKGEVRTGMWSNEAATNPIAIAFSGLQTDGDASIDQVVIGPQEIIATLAETNGAPAPTRRQFEVLLQGSDKKSDFSLLVAPSFLLGPGRELLAPIPNGRELMRETIDESIQALLFTSIFEPRWFGELRMIGTEARDAGKFTQRLKQRLESLPDQMEANLNTAPAHPYWRALANRYPQMLRSLSKYVRFGVEDGHIVSNVYLPKDAPANLGITSWMTLQNMKTNAVVANGTKSKPATNAPVKTIEEILDTNINVSFEQESLESALQAIATEVSDSVLGGQVLAMSINGSAFQKEGITRNQQIRAFKQQSVPLRTVLTDLVRRANPVTTVKSPTEKDQKVVWVVLDNPESPLKKKIDLTTRTWAEANKATLSKEFVE